MGLARVRSHTPGSILAPGPETPVGRGCNIYAGVRYNRWVIDNFYNEPGHTPLNKGLLPTLSIQTPENPRDKTASAPAEIPWAVGSSVFLVFSFIAVTL
jgi:hypothetical protein